MTGCLGEHVYSYQNISVYALEMVEYHILSCIVLYESYGTGIMQMSAKERYRAPAEVFSTIYRVAKYDTSTRITNASF